MKRVEYSKGVLKGIQQMNKGFKDRTYWENNNTVFAVIRGDEVVPSHSTACYASANHERNRGSDFLISRLLFNGLMSKDKKGDIPLYLNYLFNDSPFASAFVTKSAEQAIEDKWFVLDSTIPSNLMIGAGTAARCISEYHGVVVAFNDLVAGGTTPNLAFVLAHCMSGGEMRQGNINWNYTSGGHRCLDPLSLGMSGVSSFVKGEAVNLNESFKKQTRYDGIQDMWGKGGTALYQYIKKNYNVKELLGGGAKKSESLNPFKRKVAKPVDNGATTYEDGIRAMAIFSKQMIQELKS